MPSLPQLEAGAAAASPARGGRPPHQERTAAGSSALVAARHDPTLPSLWTQASSPFNTPPPTGDSVESISDLLGFNSMPIATQTGDSITYTQFQHQQGGPPPDYLSWAQNSTPFENTPPPQGDSFESNISDLLSLDMPRGSLLGNTNPIGMMPPYTAATSPPTYQQEYDTTSLNTTFQSPGTAGGYNKYCFSSPPSRGSGAETLGNISTPSSRKTGLHRPSLDLSPVPSSVLPNGGGCSSTFSPGGGGGGLSPICPPSQQQLPLPTSPPLHHHHHRPSPPLLSRNNSEELAKSFGSPSRGSEGGKSNGEHSNAVHNLSAVFSPNTEQEMANIQNLFALRRESDLANRIIEHTTRLILSAFGSPEVKSNSEPPLFPTTSGGTPRKHGIGAGAPPPGYSPGPPSTAAAALRALGPHQSSGLSESGAAERSATRTWSGDLPPRVHSNPTYSCKVFLGGVPWDITELTLVQAFSKFGSIKVEWPGKDLSGQANQPKGYAYVIFETEKKVKALLDSCVQDYSKGGNWYYRLSSRKLKSKEVQVIPWAVSDSSYAQVSQKLDSQKTVFVGALHGMIHAKALAKIMNDLFGGVIYAGLDTDKFKYPIGSARVSFNNHRSYMEAVRAAFIEIKTSQFSKKVQVNPYLEDSPCSACSIQHGPYFCREMSCFRYFCRGCWALHHSSSGTPGGSSHRPLTRNSGKTASSNAHNAAAGGNNNNSSIGGSGFALGQTPPHHSHSLKHQSASSLVGNSSLGSLQFERQTSSLGLHHPGGLL